MGEDLSLEDQIRRACASFEVDWQHSRQVARHADLLFQELRHLHGLTKTARPFLQASALLHDITLTEGAADHHLTAAEIIPQLRVPDLPARVRRIIATAVRFHPRRVRAKTFTNLLGKNNHPVEGEIAGRLVALLRIADGLDHCRSSGTEITAVHDTGHEVEILTDGEQQAAEDTAFTNGKTDFWNALCLRPVRITLATGDGPMKRALLRPGDTMAEAVQRIFQRQMECLISLEYGLGYDHDTEYVHEVRVATRRLRTAMVMLGKSLLNRDQLRDELSWLAEALGKVRDCDVFLEFLEGYVIRANKSDDVFIRKLIRSERRARRKHCRGLLEAIRSERYVSFRDGFYRMATSPIGSSEGMRVSGKRASRSVSRQAKRSLKRRFNALNEYRRSLKRLSSQQQHQLRIDCKKLRYTAEFFADVYPSALAEIIRPATKMQDLLGEVHDVDVWTDRIQGHVRRWRSGRDDPDTQKALGHLLQHLAERKTDCLGQAESVWRRFARKKMERGIGKVIGSPVKP